MIEVQDRSAARRFSPSRFPSRLEKEWGIVPWSALKPHIDVFEADGKERTGLFVRNNPINLIDPFGLQTNVVETSEYDECLKDMKKEKEKAAEWGYDATWDLLKGLWSTGKSPKAAKDLLDSTVKDQVKDALKDKGKDSIKGKSGATNWIDKIDNYFKEKLIKPPKPPPASTNCHPKKCP